MAKRIKHVKPMIVIHEGNTMVLPDNILKKHGFHKIITGRTNEGYDPGYTHKLRIHELQYLLYDSTGFITWQRIVVKGDKIMKGSAGKSADAYITIPKPIRTGRDLKKLLDAITMKIK